MRALRTYLPIITPIDINIANATTTVIATITRSHFLFSHRSASHAPASDLLSLAPSVLEFVHQHTRDALTRSLSIDPVALSP